MSSDVSLVSIIIPVKDDAQRLERCLEALDQQTYGGDVEILVIDNGSSDHPERVVDRFARARFLREPAHGSYAARNAGLREAQGQVLAFTDSDCIPAPDWLEVGVRAIQAAGEDAFVGGRVELFAKDPEHPNPGEVWDLRQGFHQQRYIEQEHFSATASLFVHRSAFDRAGPFQQEFVSSGDREWGNRATANGLKGRYVPDLLTRHPCRDSLRALRRKNARLLQGDIQLRRERGQALITPKEALIALCPPIPTLIRELPKVRPATVEARRNYLWAALYITYTNLFDRVRVLRREWRRPAA